MIARGPGSRSRHAARAVSLATVALLACLAAGAEAGVQNIPCRRPFVFRNAAVNVVVLPYESPAEITRSADLGTHLAGLVQVEVLRSIAKFGSVGAVQMVGTPSECEPDLVVSKLLGQVPGAQATIGRGQGLVVVWGRFFTRDGELFIQTYCRFLRAGVDETLDLVAREQRLSGRLSAQAFACAPRRVTVEDLDNFERQFNRSTILRAEPRDEARGTPMRSDPFPYWISDTQGDWMRITSSGGGGQSGWIHLGGAREAWSLARWLPELLYVEGMVGYLRYRVATQVLTPPAAPAMPRGPARPQWIEAASRALADYEQAIALPTGTEDAPALPWRTALAGAVQLQLRGILALTKPDATSEDRERAATLFDRAAAAAPHDGNARNLAAMLRLANALGAQDGPALERVTSDLLRALGADPGNRFLFANLRSAYQALSNPQAAQALALSDERRRSYQEQLAALDKVRVGGGR